MKITKLLQLLSIIMVVVAFSLFVSDKPLLAQENPEELQSCVGREGDVEDIASQACVIRDCDCNRTANNGKVGELICMEARTVRNDAGAVQYVCKFPNSPTGVSCDTIGITCPGANSNSGSPVDNSTSAQTYDPNQPSTTCEEKVIQWEADKACDGQYNRFVSLDRWQSSVFDPSTGRCKEFFLPNSVTDEKCGAGVEACAPGPVDQSCSEKDRVCLADGAEACKETWRDENCEVATKIGKLTGQMCKSDAARLDITSAVQAAAQGSLSSEAKEFGINLTFGFKDRSTVHSEFRLKIGADQSGNSQPKTIWDIAAVWIDGTRFTLNPNNYNANNFNLSSVSSDVFVYLLTTKVSEQTYEAHPTIQIEFGDGSLRDGTLDILIEPGWVGTAGPKTIEQMINALTKVTVINPYTRDYFYINKEEIVDFAKQAFPGEIPNYELSYYISVPVKFRDGTELTSSATFILRQSAAAQDKTETIWDITGIEMNGYNFTLNPDNIQPNNFTFAEHPEVIGQILNLEVPTKHTEVPIRALVKFQDGTTRDAELNLVFEPGQVGTNPPRTITDALSNIQNITLVNSYGDVYNFYSDSIRNGIGQVMNDWIPDGQMEITIPIDLTSVQGAHRYDNITLVYQPEGTSIPSSNSGNSSNEITPPVDNTQPAPQAPLEMVDARRICMVRSDTKQNCLAFYFGSNPCFEAKPLEEGNLYIGFKFLNDGINRYFRLDQASDDLKQAAPSLDVMNTFLGLLQWDQSVSLTMKESVRLPKDVQIIPITIQDLKDRNNPKTYTLNARLDEKASGTSTGCQ